MKVVFNKHQKKNLLFNYLTHLFKKMLILCAFFRIYFILIFVIFRDLESGTLLEVAVLYS